MVKSTQQLDEGGMVSAKQLRGLVTLLEGVLQNTIFHKLVWEGGRRGGEGGNVSGGCSCVEIS
jgi:hypothetical protein